MIYNSNRSGTATTVPDSKKQSQGTGARSGKVQDNDKSDTGTLEIKPSTRIEVKDGKLVVRRTA